MCRLHGGGGVCLCMGDNIRRAVTKHALRRPTPPRQDDAPRPPDAPHPPQPMHVHTSRFFGCFPAAPQKPGRHAPRRKTGIGGPPLRGVGGPMREDPHKHAGFAAPDRAGQRNGCQLCRKTAMHSLIPQHRVPALCCGKNDARMLSQGQPLTHSGRTRLAVAPSCRGGSTPRAAMARRAPPCLVQDPQRSPSTREVIPS